DGSVQSSLESLGDAEGKVLERMEKSKSEVGADEDDRKKEDAQVEDGREAKEAPVAEPAGKPMSGKRAFLSNEVDFDQFSSEMGLPAEFKRLEDWSAKDR